MTIFVIVVKTEYSIINVLNSIITFIGKLIYYYLLFSP